MIAAAVIIGAAYAEYEPWAGQLTSLQPRESLIVRPLAVSSTSDLLISVTDNGPTNLTIVNIFFNDTAITNTGVGTSGALIQNRDGSFSLLHGATGSIDIPKQDLGAVSSGTTYEVVVATAMGNSYSASVRWP